MSFVRITFRAVIFCIIIITYEVFGKQGHEWEYFLSIIGVLMLWNLYDWYLKE